jgi:UDP-2,3-diacylglucosamine pyrophosphatase LpxH
LYVRRNEAEFVLYGHTHRYRILPVDVVPMTGETMQKAYFNTGTWRKIHVKTAYDVESHEFLSWRVRGFEVWNGALG